MGEDLQKEEFEIVSDMMRLLKPLDKEDQRRIIQTVITFYGLSNFEPHSQLALSYERPQNPSSPKNLNSSIPYSEQENNAISPKEFLMEKRPQSDVERIACLAYFLTHYRDQPYFKGLDLNILNTEAAQPRFSNLSKTAGNALAYGYLALAPKKGLKQISAFGEAFVRALPDRDAAKQAMKSKPKSGRAKIRARKIRENNSNES